MDISLIDWKLLFMCRCETTSNERRWENDWIWLDSMLDNGGGGWSYKKHVIIPEKIIANYHTSVIDTFDTQHSYFRQQLLIYIHIFPKHNIIAYLCEWQADIQANGRICHIRKQVHHKKNRDDAFTHSHTISSILHILTDSPLLYIHFHANFLYSTLHIP